MRRRPLIVLKNWTYAGIRTLHESWSYRWVLSRVMLIRCVCRWCSFMEKHTSSNELSFVRFGIVGGTRVIKKYFLLMTMIICSQDLKASVKSESLTTADNKKKLTFIRICFTAIFFTIYVLNLYIQLILIQNIEWKKSFVGYMKFNASKNKGLNAAL